LRGKHEEPDHQAQHADEHQDQARGLDRDAGHGRRYSELQHRTNRDQEYRRSDGHDVHIPARLG
jgi:hypothetical protein